MKEAGGVGMILMNVDAGTDGVVSEVGPSAGGWRVIADYVIRWHLAGL